ncbi:MAG: DNA topoisomerase IB [Anaerolineaceae bacterium]|nr:DNA topoisomerase IB [Anaerolineaceae bacterium]
MEELAQQANLCYVNDSEPGYHRKRWGRGFTFLDEKDNHITDEKIRSRLEALVIPPAWTDVWICRSPDGHIQATGRDEKGRKQYIYHPDWEEVRNQVKFGRMRAFGEALPALRAQVDADMRSHKLSWARVVALVVSLLDKTLLRVGNAAYTQANGSFGLTTLHDAHTAVSGSYVTFSFSGKGGKHQEVSLQDRRLARQVQQCQELPGQHLFQYIGEDGERYDLTSTDVNHYLHQHTGQDFSAKDFRTWGATICAAEKLAELGPAESEAQAEKNLTTAVKYAAEQLGNTYPICRQYYVHPHVLEAYQAGQLVDQVQKVQSGQQKVIDGLSELETAVLTILSQ